MNETYIIDEPNSTSTAKLSIRDKKLFINVKRSMLISQSFEFNIEDIDALLREEQIRLQ